MNNEIADLIAEIEKEEEFDNIVTEVTAPFEGLTLDSESEEIVEIAVPEAELMEDDVLVETDNTAIQQYNIGDTIMLSTDAVNISGSEIPNRFK